MIDTLREEIGRRGGAHENRCSPALTERGRDSSFDPPSTLGRQHRLNRFRLMFASLITLPHFSVSSAMSMANSAGEPPQRRAIELG
jgi:hypothetical protein